MHLVKNIFISEQHKYSEFFFCSPIFPLNSNLQNRWGVLGNYGTTLIVFGCFWNFILLFLPLDSNYSIGEKLEKIVRMRIRVREKEKKFNKINKYEMEKGKEKIFKN